MSKKLIKVSDKYPNASRLEEGTASSLFYDSSSKMFMNVNKAGFILREWEDVIDADILSALDNNDDEEIEDYYVGEE